MVEAAGQQRISRLLIVEDDDAQRRTLTDVMRAEHFEVLCCGTAAEALQHVEKGGFGVAIVDLGLPDLPGTKLLEKIRAMSDQVRVIIHTGYGSFDSAKTAVNLGAFAYVEKLSDPAELIGHVHRAFQEGLRSYADELEREIAKRKRVEEALRKAHDDLEIRVTQRTSELATANEGLRAEITEHRRTEKELRESQRQYQVLAEVSPVGVFHTDSEGNCLYVNEQWCKIAGMTAEEAQGEGWACGVHPEDRERVFKEWYEAAREVLPFQSEYRFETRDGATTWVLGQARPERDKSGEISGYVGTITDINERKEAEEELRTFKLISDSSNDSHFLVNREARFRYVNRVACEKLGYSEAELLHLRVPDVDTEHDTVKYQELFDRIQSETVPAFETTNRRKNGDTFPSEISTTGISLAGEPYMFAALRDITERKGAEEALRESEAKYRAHVEDIPAITYMAGIDDASTTQYISPQVQTILGLSPTALLENPELWRERLHPDDRDRVMRELAASHASGARFQSEYRMLAADDHVVWFRDQATVVRDGEGKPLFLQGVMFDITESKRAEEALRQAHHELEIRVSQRTSELSAANERLRAEITERTRAEQALRESEDRFRAIADYTYDWETWVGPDGKVLWINPAVERMTGYTVKECLAMADYPQRMVREDDRQNIAEAFSDNACQCTSGNDVPFRIRCKDGTIRWGAVSWQPIHRGDGVCLGIRSSVRDITDRKRAEEQVKTQQAELAHASRLSSMGEMISGLAHELNQPLGAICSYADACKRMLESGSLEAVAETVDKLAGQAERAGEIVRRVQRFVRKGRPQRSTVDVNNIIRETIRMVQSETMLKGIVIALDLCDRAPVVLGDPIQIQQVILNLLRNALDAIGQAEAGHHKITIRSSMVEGVSVLVRVCDTGVGLDGRAVEQIFDAFYTTKPGGMGMGLSISRSIVEAHGGKRRVTPNRERGATFYLLLPAKDGIQNGND